MIIITSSKEIDVGEYGLKCLKPHFTSPELSHDTESMDGRDGELYIESKYNPRPITAEMLVKSVDLTDLYLLESELYKLFSKKEQFYIIFKRIPKKRWKVILNKPFEVDKVNFFTGSFELEFISFSVFAESIGTTLDPLTTDADLWQVGEGLIGDDMIYVHSTNTFKIFNAGDIEVDPRIFPLVIKFKGPSTKLTIRNKTTGDTWSFKGQTQATDVIEINQIRSLKNGTSIFKDTNKKLISIVPGWNDFEITGATSPFEISFDFRFYYF